MNLFGTILWSPCLVTYTPPHKTLPAKMSSNIVQIVQSSRVEHFLEASPQPRCSAAFFGAWQLLAPGQNRLPPNSIYTNWNYIRSPMLVCLYWPLCHICTSRVILAPLCWFSLATNIVTLSNDLLPSTPSTPTEPVSSIERITDSDVKPVFRFSQSSRPSL